MKKVNFFCTFMCTIIYSTILISCSESNTHEFSHDSKIDSWVKENKKEIQSYNRRKITSYSLEKQKAILRSLSPDKRKQLWQEKVNHILTLDLSKDEKEYLKWFAEIFKKLNYKETAPEYLSEKMRNKVLEAKEKFDWSDKLIHDLFFNINDVDLKSKRLPSQNNTRISQDPPSTCECRYDWGCGWGSDCLGNDDCEFDNGDCGVFGTSNCNGSCSE